MKKTISRNGSLEIRKTDKSLKDDDSSSSPRISFEEAQQIVHNVITHINTGRGRVWSKLTAA